MSGKVYNVVNSIYREAKKIPLLQEQLDTLKLKMREHCKEIGLNSDETEEYLRIACEKYQVVEEGAAIAS